MLDRKGCLVYICVVQAQGCKSFAKPDVQDETK